jgi:hypothetical protein
MVCRDDGEAVAKAKRMVDDHDIEVWSSDRFGYQADSQAEVSRDFEMKSIVAICMAVVFLWVADIELNDGRYSDVTGRAIAGLGEK